MEIYIHIQIYLIGILWIDEETDVEQSNLYSSTIINSAPVYNNALTALGRGLNKNTECNALQPYQHVGRLHGTTKMCSAVATANPYPYYAPFHWI